MIKVFLLRIMIFNIAFTFGQSKTFFNSKNDKIKIPFELSNNLIIVDAVFNNIPLKMIVDTGADSNLLFSYPVEDTIRVDRNKRLFIKGIGTSQSIEAFLASGNKFTIKEYLDNNFEILIVPNLEINLVNKLGIPINGILGYSFFKDYLVEIDYERELIFLHANKEKAIRKRAKKFKKSSVEVENFKPYLQLKTALDKQEYQLKLLFDTGLSDGLWLFESKTISSDRYYIQDYLGRGLSGDIKGKRSRVNKISFSDIEVNEALVSYPDSLFFKQISLVKGRNGSLGGDIIKRFNWFLDYENEVFYFKKNKLLDAPFEYNMSGMEVQHSGSELIKKDLPIKKFVSVDKEISYVVDRNETLQNFRFELKPTFEVCAIREASPADMAGLKVGDKIIKINNKLAYNLNLQKFTTLFQSEAGKKIKITVERDGKVLNFEFLLEKIL